MPADRRRPRRCISKRRQAPHGWRQVDLRRRAAEQFLIGGHIDHGMDVIRTVLRGRQHAAGAKSACGAVVVIVAARSAPMARPALCVEARRQPSTPATPARRYLLVGDARVPRGRHQCGGFQHPSSAAGARGRDPYRLARAVALESVARAASPSGRKLSERLAQQSKALRRSVGHAHVIAMSIVADAISAMAAGEWKKALTPSEHALAILRDQCVGLTWELNMAQNIVIWALMYLGELGEVSRRVPALLASARSSGKLYPCHRIVHPRATTCGWRQTTPPKGSGNRRGHRAVVAGGLHRRHYSAMLARVQTALYRGNGEAAWRLFDEQVPVALRRSLMTRVQVFRIESVYLRARSALAMAARRGDSRRFLSVARAGARHIARERRPWSDPIALPSRRGLRTSRAVLRWP